MKTIEAKDYAEGFVETHDFNEYIDESYWDRDFDTDHCLEWMLSDAKKEGYELTNVDAFDHDGFFYNVYKCTEKGLS